jgi:HlyD family secretion protein
MDVFRDPSLQDKPLEPKSGWAHQRWSRAALFAGVLIAIFAIARWVTTVSANGSTDASKLSIATVRRGDFLRDVVGDAVVVARTSRTLAASWEGVATLAVHPGDPVVQGAVLVTIKSSDLVTKLREEDALLQSLEADVSKVAALVEMQGNLARDDAKTAELEEQAAARELARKRRAFELGAYPDYEVRAAEDLLATAKMKATRAAANLALQLEILKQDARSHRLARDRQAALVEELQRKTDQLVVRSPVSGQVAQLFVTEGSLVARDAPIISVVDLSSLDLEARLPEAMARGLPIGSVAEATFYGATHKARVVAVSPEVVRGEVATRLQFAGTQPIGLRQGQHVVVRVVLEHRANTLIIPLGPYLEEFGGKYLYVVSNGKAVRKPIRFGSVSSDSVEILSGLSEGERVVISGSGDFGGKQTVLLN